MAQSQLQMLWPEARSGAPPAVRLAPDYALRTYRPGDEARFYQVMSLAGKPIHLDTEAFRLLALRTHVRLEYIPYLCAPQATSHWQAICASLRWPFTPEAWPSTMA
jgi:hypothetical protein